MFRIPHKLFLLGPILMMALGMSMNATVIASNHHKMPVLVEDCDSHKKIWEESDDLIHGCMASDTKLKFLADWFFIPGVGTASPGDFFEWESDQTLYPGLLIWVTLMIVDYNKKNGN